MRRVLFVDDESAVLEAQRRVWRPLRAQWEVETAEGGEAGIERLKTQTFDAVVCDARMPGIGGEQVLRACQALQPEAIRIVLSGQIDFQRGSALAAVAHQFLVKPTSAAGVLAAINDACAARDSLTNPTVRRLVVGLGGLAVAPKLSQRLVAMLEQPDVSVEAVSAVVEESPVVCATVLRLVSSAFFGLPRKVTNANEAVVLLGFEVMRQVVLAAEVFQGPDPLGIIEATQRRAIAVSRAAKTIASAMPLATLAVEAAVMTDLGICVLSQQLPDAYAAVWRKAHTAAALCALETEAFGASHPEIGAAFLAMWNLPPVVVTAVAQHHQPVRQAVADVTAVVALATLIDEEASVQGAEKAAVTAEIDVLAERFSLAAQVARARDDRGSTVGQAA